MTFQDDKRYVSLSGTARLTRDRALVERLWQEITEARYGMLGVVGSHDHFQPMAVFPEREASTLWFFTRKDTEIARAAQDANTEAMFILQSKDQEVQACIGGRLLQDGSRTVIDQYWNPVVAAWYPKGKDDPTLAILVVTPDAGEYWDQTGLAGLRYLVSSVKAYAAGTKAPDGTNEEQNAKVRL